MLAAVASLACGGVHCSPVCAVDTDTVAHENVLPPPPFLAKDTVMPVVPTGPKLLPVRTVW